ncbi:MAG: pantoate--beta-alanine ligase [Planctomycetota bacterium]|nr:pantoate--beta-alanine ligase [Planctomycetota bacterium]
MKVLSSSEETYRLVDQMRMEGKRIGLVPTMGALHEGHLSLVQRAKQQCDMAIATIFVNPSQFGPNEDFQKYPRTLQNDLNLLADKGCDLVFTPTNAQMYPQGHSTFIEPPSVAEAWEGPIRPGHFRGVATIVLKLFQILPAHVGYFGRKDYQQVAVIRAMCRDLNLPIAIEACQTVRESDGLAMSSRNRYLSPSERQRALGLFRALEAAEKLIQEGCISGRQVEQAMRKELETSLVDSIDYAAIVHPDTLESIETIDSEVVGIIAARLGATRLIDNATFRLT